MDVVADVTKMEREELEDYAKLYRKEAKARQKDMQDVLQALGDQRVVADKILWSNARARFRAQIKECV